MKIVLKNNTSYSVLDSSNENLINMQIELSQVEAVKNTLTDENLTSFKFTTNDDALMSEYSNKELNHLTYADGIASFILSNVDVTEKKVNEALKLAAKNNDSIMGLSDMLIMSTVPTM